MLTFGLPRGIRHCDGLTRREVVRVGDLSIFMRPSAFDRKMAQRLIDSHAFDPR